MANSLYEITNIQQKTVAGGPGNFMTVMAVTFKTTKSGLVGSVDVPVDQFSPDEVAKLVGAQATLLEQVKAL